MKDSWAEVWFNPSPKLRCQKTWGFQRCCSILMKKKKKRESNIQHSLWGPEQAEVLNWTLEESFRTNLEKEKRRKSQNFVFIIIIIIIIVFSTTVWNRLKSQNFSNTKYLCWKTVHGLKQNNYLLKRNIGFKTLKMSESWRTGRVG